MNVLTLDEWSSPFLSTQPKRLQNSLSRKSRSPRSSSQFNRSIPIFERAKSTSCKQAEEGISSWPDRRADKQGTEATSTIVAETGRDNAKNAVPAEESETSPQDNLLQSKRLDTIDQTLSAEDPKYRQRLDAIECSVVVIDLFENIFSLAVPAVPDVLGQALKDITKILEKLKVRSSFSGFLKYFINIFSVHYLENGGE